MRRVPALEELLKRPILQKQRMTAEMLADLQTTPVPIPPRILWQSLHADPMVGSPVLTTDPAKYCERDALYQRAAWLIKSAVIRMSLQDPDWSRRGGRGALRAMRFIVEETQRMHDEICRTGLVGHERNDIDYLAGPELKTKLSAEQWKHLERVSKPIIACDTLHPVLKQRMVQEIGSVLHQSSSK